MGDPTCQNKFYGPVFIVGMPRSGTKLLRGLLNEHPCISIPDIETEFLPTWLYNWQKYGDLSNQRTFKQFYSKVTSSSYFTYMKENGRLIDVNVWYNLCRNYNAASVFEAMIRHDANVPNDSMIIWGDKSPGYIKHLPLLKKYFPGSRFIHIIRDVRDYCLSINVAWSKNMIRAAQRWFDDIKKIQIDSKNYHSDYLEVRYEDLITQPSIILNKICVFLDVQFLPHMVCLSKPSENIGDARGLKTIKSNNTFKYHRGMDAEIRNKIEEITYPLLRSCGYRIGVLKKKRSIRKYQMIFYQILDGLNLLRYYARGRGRIPALKSGLLHFKRLGLRG